jgi:uncharacterized protein YbbC (DUF1343 family)
MIRTGLDRLLERVTELEGRRFGLLGHAASVSRELVPAHLALARAGAPPRVLLGPEHGYHGVEQDMVPSTDRSDPWTGVGIVSLYGEDESTLRPSPRVFADLDLVLIDVQDVGSRYYTYAATAVWVCEAALDAGCEVWLLDRPNPLGGERIEGNLRRPGFESFVGAFEMPVRHGLTVAEIVRLELRRAGRPEEGLRIWSIEGWRRRCAWRDLGRTWIAPSPNMPMPQTAEIYPGLCLLEGTELSEGRGTTRPFHLFGAPDLDPLAAVGELESLELPGVRFVPTYFRPQFHKHAGRVCGGIEVAVTDPESFAPYLTGVRLLEVLHRVLPDGLEWRREAYEFVGDRPAIDLLSGDRRLREALEAGRPVDDWIAGWEADEERFRAERESILLYD